MQILGPSSSYTDYVTAASSTATSFASLILPPQTIKALNTGVTTPSASSFLIQGPPIAGQNQTITNGYAFFVQSGSSKLAGPLILAQNSTSNSTTIITSPSSTTNYTLTLPPSTPTSSGQALLSDVNGVLSWGAAGLTGIQSTFSGANNVTTPSTVNGLSVNTGPLVIPVYVYVNATSKLAALFNLNIYNNPNTNGYSVDGASVGDNTLVKFSIDTSGQIYYTSGNYTGFTSLTFTWFSPNTQVSSITSSLALSSSLSVGANTSLATNQINGTPSSTNGSLLFINGSTFTDISTAASSTTPAFNGTYLAAPTLKATNTGVITSTASTFTIGGAPTASTNQTITSAYAFRCFGDTLMNGNLFLNGRMSSETKDFLEFSMSSSTVASSNPANTSTAVIWNTTPTSQTGFPNYTTSAWSGGSSFTPGIIGQYLITWAVNSNTATGTGTNEIQIFRNSTNAYGTTNQLALANIPVNAAESVVSAIFNVTAVTDYVYFGWYNANTSAVTFTGGGGLARNYLRIIRL